MIPRVVLKTVLKTYRRRIVDVIDGFIGASFDASG